MTDVRLHPNHVRAFLQGRVNEIQREMRSIDRKRSWTRHEQDTMRDLLIEDLKCAKALQRLMKSHHEPMEWA